MVRAAAKNHPSVAVVVEPGGVRGGAGRGRRGRHHARAAQAPRRPGLRAHGVVRHRRRLVVLVVVRAGRRRALPGLPRRDVGAHGGAALRREPAPGRGALRPTGQRRARSPPPSSCTARRCPTTTTSTPTPRCAPRTTSRDPVRRDHQARQPVRHRGRRRRRRGPRQGARLRPGVGVRRRHRDQPAGHRWRWREQVAEVFTEVVVAPAYEDGAVELLSKKPSIRLLREPRRDAARVELRPVDGGVLLQAARPVPGARRRPLDLDARDRRARPTTRCWPTSPSPGGRCAR